MSKQTTKPKKVNALLPRNQHSCFGDFPKDSAPKRQALVVEPVNLGAAEQSTAIQKRSK
jgi:hypothetical protein